MLGAISQLLVANHSHFRLHVHEGSIAFRQIILRLAEHERRRNGQNVYLKDEQVWVHLILNGYCFSDGNHLKELFEILTGITPPTNYSFWIEALPKPPRPKEGRSHIDVACGSIVGTEETIGGIEYLPPEEGEGSVCFVEAKFLSDIAVKTTHDAKRNQLARVAESLLNMQSSEGNLPADVILTLLTPEYFREQTIPASRFYAYKFVEYKDSSLISADLVEEARERSHTLKLRWVTFEELIDKMPPNDLKALILDFLKIEKKRGTIMMSRS